MNTKSETENFRKRKYRKIIGKKESTPEYANYQKNKTKEHMKWDTYVSFYRNIESISPRACTTFGLTSQPCFLYSLFHFSHCSMTACLIFGLGGGDATGIFGVDDSDTLFFLESLRWREPKKEKGKKLAQ